MSKVLALGSAGLDYICRLSPLAAVAQINDSGNQNRSFNIYTPRLIILVIFGPVPQKLNRLLRWEERMDNRPEERIG